MDNSNFTVVYQYLFMVILDINFMIIRQLMQEDNFSQIIKFIAVIEQFKPKFDFINYIRVGFVVVFDFVNSVELIDQAKFDSVGYISFEFIGLVSFDFTPIKHL